MVISACETDRTRKKKMMDDLNMIKSSIQRLASDGFDDDTSFYEGMVYRLHDVLERLVSGGILLE